MFRSLPVLEIPGGPRNGQSGDADSAHMDSMFWWCRGIEHIYKQQSVYLGFRVQNNLLHSIVQQSAGIRNINCCFLQEKHSLSELK